MPDSPTGRDLTALDTIMLAILAHARHLNAAPANGHDEAHALAGITEGAWEIVRWAEERGSSRTHGGT